MTDVNLGLFSLLHLLNREKVLNIESLLGVDAWQREYDLTAFNCCNLVGYYRVTDSWSGGEEEEGEASLCSGKHGERFEQSRQGFYALD